MREVSVRIFHFAVEIARTGGLEEGSLVAGLSSLAPVNGVLPESFDWDDFVVLWERLEDGLGGPEGLARSARLAMPTAYPEFRAFAAIFVTPLALFRFMMLRHFKTSFRNVSVKELERRPGSHVRWRVSIDEPYRGSEAFHRATRTFSSLIPVHLGLPEAEVEITRLTPRTAELIGRFPRSEPLPARGRHAASLVSNLVAAQIDEAYSLIIEKLQFEKLQREPVVAPKDRNDWAVTLALSRRQREVFELLVEGRANKDIAGALSCSERNVEFHVGRILRAARVSSRAELLVKVLGKSS